MALKTNDDGKLLRQLILSKGFAKPVIDSYNNVIINSIPKIIETYDIKLVNGDIIKFSELKYIRPSTIDMKKNGVQRPLYPMEARRKNMPYMAVMKITARRYNYINNKLVAIPEEVIKDVTIGSIPVMIGSILDHLGKKVIIDFDPTQDPLYETERIENGEGPVDPGGYFQIKTQEKVLLNIEHLRTLYPFLYADKGEYTVRYTSQTLTESKLVVVYEKKNILNVRFTPMRKDSIPLNIYYIFYALGITSSNMLDEIRKIFHRYIVDTDCERLIKRRKDFDNYMKVTETSFKAVQGNLDPKSIAKVIHETFIESSSDLSSTQLEDVPDIVIRDLFVNVSVIDVKKRLNEMRSSIRIQQILLQQRLVQGLITNEKVAEEDAKLVAAIKVIENELRELISSKINILASMVVKYVELQTGYRQADDRDSWGCKRLQDAGANIEYKFIEIWKNWIQDTQTELIKKHIKSIKEISIAIKPTMITKSFIDAFVKGIWGNNKTKARDFAVVDALSRDNLLSTYAHIRRISTPTHKEAAIREKRLIHNSSWGVICPSNTPEGATCGLVKDPSLLLYTSLNRPVDKIYQLLLKLYIPWSTINGILSGKTPMNSQDAKILIHGKITGLPIFKLGCEIKDSPKNTIELSPAMNSIYINGRHFGYGDGQLIRETMVQYRRNREIPFDVGILIDPNFDIWIYTNAGRLCRPLLIVNKDTQKLIIDEKKLRGAPILQLMDKGALEYIDISEQLTTNIIICESSKFLETKSSILYTHCEVDPTCIIGISASIMPFPETNPAPRVTYQCAMGKQAIGQDISSAKLLFRVTDRILNEPDVPLVATDAHQTLGMDEFPSGKNITIAILTSRGWNQEDATTISKTASDIGMFHLTIYSSYTTTIDQSTQTKQYIAMPDKLNATKNYSKLDPLTHMARIGTYVNADDCLIAKKILVTKMVDNVKTTESIDGSVYVDIGKEGYVDDITIKENSENNKLIRIRLREPRQFGIGDKMASRYSQKGVCADVRNEIAMPTVVSDNQYIDGIVPDVIFNPLGIPTRQTVGKLLEIVSATIAAITGERYNATAFRKHDINKMYDILESLGFQRDCKTKLRDGVTGNIIDADIFFGPIYYQVLRHFVKDKMQARGYGEYHFLNRQPISGIRRKGGLRFGEMERDAIIAYGASHLIRERTMISSDWYRMIVCKNCGQYAKSNAETGEIRCKVCIENEFRNVEIPFSFKLLTQYLSGANIKVSIRTSS